VRREAGWDSDRGLDEQYMETLGRGTEAEHPKLVDEKEV
jgi:hypothetical protein